MFLAVLVNFFHFIESDNIFKKYEHVRDIKGNIFMCNMYGTSSVFLATEIPKTRLHGHFYVH